MKNIARLTVLIFTVLVFIECKKAPESNMEPVQLGELHINFSGDAAAMPFFEKGLKLLHNFEYDDACAEFLKAQELDSILVMAYWGEAMTYNHPLWRQQDFEKGQAALEKLAPSLEERKSLAKTDLEIDFLKSMEIMYGNEGGKKLRDSLYSNQLGKMYEKYVGNEEVAAFYALSMLGAVKAGKNIAAYEKGANVVKGILDENPNHPGALHYLIHSYDYPSHAPMALQAAQSYSKVAADATHALHMPSHIFVQVGMWEEVINSNIASWEASVRRVKEKGIEDSAGSYHALHWLHYGLLQKGKIAEAKKLLLNMKTYADEMPEKGARDYLISMKANYLVETGNWESEMAGFDCKKDDLGVLGESAYFYIEGMKAFNTRQTDLLSAAIDEIKEKIENASNLVTDEGLPMCSAAGANRYAPNQLDLDKAKVMELELRGMLAFLQKDMEQADQYYADATNLNNKINYSFAGPPTIAKPAPELYGDFLLEMGEYQKAAAQFDQALEQGPNRKMALKGRLKIANLMEDAEKVKELEMALAKYAGASDSKSL